MSSQDKHPQGGSITDLAVDGTHVPSDAAVPRVIPSVPNPGQARQIDDPDYNSAAGPADAATNAVDIPRTVRDQGTTGEVETVSGHAVGGAVETKNLSTGSAPDGSAVKGHPRDEGLHKQKGSDHERLASDGPTVDPAPGEEELSQETLQSRRDGQ